MKSIFLRIYGGMLLALLLVSGLGLLGLHWINEVRGEHYREELARGTFRLMADNLQPMTATERKRALAQWSRLLGIPLQLRGLDELRMDGRSRARLMNGQVLVKQTAEHAVTVYTQASAAENLVLSGEVQQVSEQLARATVYLLMDELVRYPASEQPYHLARIVRDKRFGFPVHLLQVKELDLDDDQRGHVTTPLMRLQDPDHTKIIVVTLPETTPVTEAQALASDLERANIHPWAWVVNNSLAAAHPTSPLLATRARSEQQQLDAVAATTNRMAVIPTQTREPVGTQQLTALSN